MGYEMTNVQKCQSESAVKEKQMQLVELHFYFSSYTICSASAVGEMIR